MKVGKLGLIVNPVAGGGLDEKKVNAISEAMRGLKRELGFDTLFVERTLKLKLEELGLELNRLGEVVEVELNIVGSREDTLKIVKEMDKVSDVIAVFGGEGTMSDVASAFPEKPLVCFGIGTTNVSPVLTQKAENLRMVEMRGMVLHLGGERRVAFNDVVVGSTVLTTLNGRKVQVDAREYMKGRKVVSLPRKFHAEVRAGSRFLKGEFGNIFVSIPDRRFLGKGIAGGASLSAFVGFRGVVACISEGIVVSTYSKEDVMKMEPIVTKTISFDDEVVIRADEMVSCDGNPVGEGECKVRIRDGVVRVLKRV